MIAALGWLLAAESPSLPTELTALGALLLIVFWLVRRSDAADKTRDDELASTRKELADERRTNAEMEKQHAAEVADLRRSHAGELDEIRRMHALELEQCRQTSEIYRAERHRIVTHYAAARAALNVVRTAIDSCTCNALDLVAPHVNDVLADLEETP